MRIWMSGPLVLLCILFLSQPCSLRKVVTRTEHNDDLASINSVNKVVKQVTPQWIERHVFDLDFDPISEPERLKHEDVIASIFHEVERRLSPENGIYPATQHDPESGGRKPRELYKFCLILATYKQFQEGQELTFTKRDRQFASDLHQNYVVEYHVQNTVLNLQVIGRTVTFNVIKREPVTIDLKLALDSSRGLDHYTASKFANIADKSIIDAFRHYGNARKSYTTNYNIIGIVYFIIKMIYYIIYYMIYYYDITIFIAILSALGYMFFCSTNRDKTH